MKNDSTNINLEISIDYANAVLNEKIPACKYIKLACQNFLLMLDRPDLYYNSGAVDKVITFINSLELTESSAGLFFNLQPFQTFIISNIYGFYFRENNKRKHKYIYIEIPRKNGKSMLINALALYHLIFDVDSQVVISANSKDQAKNVNFKQCKIYSTQIDKKQKHLKQLYSKIKYLNSELIVSASDSTKLDGLNCSTAIVDELHEAKSSAMYDVLKSSQGSRLEPLLLVITTSGFSTDSFCYQLRNYNIEILEGKKTDDSQFTMIYTLDESDDYTLEKNWYKANPNLEISVYKDFIQSEVNKAVNNPIESHSVKVKNFNIWLQNKNEESKYIDLSYVKKSMQKINIDDEKFKGLEIWAGCDLAAVSDITAVSYMIQLDDYFYFFNRYFLPENNINSGVNRLQYKRWCTEGYITLTSGNVTDYEFITNEVVERNKVNEITLLSYDSWNSIQWAISTTQEGLNLKPYSQSTGSINKPLKELSRLIQSDKVIIEYNPVTLWMFNNAIVKEYGENIRIDKKKKGEKIDGVMSMAMALGGYLNSPQYNFNIY